MALVTSQLTRAIKSSIATGSAAIAETLAPGRAWRLVDIRVHLSGAGGAANLTATLDHSGGAAYDNVILTQDMSSIVDMSISDSGFVPMSFDAGTELDIAWTNGSARTYGLELVWQEI